MIRKFKLWILFACTVTVIMISTFFITGFLTFLNIRSNPGSVHAPVGWLPIISLAITALLVSSSFTLLVTRRFFVPIEQLIAALKQISSGDFHVRLPETAETSEVLEMNVSFNKMVKELNAMEMLQSDFIQNVSHEFKTPLSVIEGYAALLDTAALPDELHGYAGRILESTKQLSSLTGNILRLSKLENQQIISEKNIFSVDEQLRQCVLSMEPLWSAKRIRMQIDLPEVFYYGNEDLLFQVWTNLLSNAIKFTHEGGFISLRLKTSNGEIRVIVQDSGIGMNEQVRAHIFDKFYQGEQNRNIEGNGLGLSLVKKIVELCQGTVAVESEPGVGSSFTILLPPVS